MTIEALTVLRPFVKNDRFDVETIRGQLSSGGLPDVAAALPLLRQALQTGNLTQRAWDLQCPDTPLDDFVVAFGALWGALEDQGLAREADGFPPMTPELWSQWAYTEGWYLMSQDEDLMLMNPRAFEHLLAAAANEDCPKRGYIFACIAHAMRDDVFEAAGTERFAAKLQMISSHRGHVVAADAPHLLAYVDRLLSYGERSPVAREGALQRGLDLNRCGQPKPEAVSIEETRRAWVVHLPSTPPKTIVIDKANAEISLPRR